MVQAPRHHHINITQNHSADSAYHFHHLIYSHTLLNVSHPSTLPIRPQPVRDPVAISVAVAPPSSTRSAVVSTIISATTIVALVVTPIGVARVVALAVKAKRQMLVMAEGKERGQNNSITAYVSSSTHGLIEPLR